MGTLDFSICEVSEGMVEVLASHGDVFLGGADVDNALVDWMAEEFMKDHAKVDLRKDPMALARLVEAAEKAKIELSTSTTTDINLPYITVMDSVPQMLLLTLTRAKFEQLIQPIVDKVINCAREALRKADKKASEIDEILLVGGSCRIPAIQNALTNTFNRPLNKGANLDEAVALGAAIQANTLAGNVEDAVLLLDVTPISLGIETMGNVMTTLIPANTTIPTSKKQVFSTAVDNQPGVGIVVLQGERPMSKDNKTIGQFELDGIAPAPRGVPQIEVTFDIDANGILSVSAKDLATNKEQHITINNQNSLSQEEIDRIKADAEKFKEEDEKKRKDLEEVNHCEGYAYSVKQTLENEQFKDKFTEDEKNSVNEKLEALNKALENRSDVEAIKNAKNALEEVFKPIVTKLYEEAAKANAPQGDQASQAFKDNFNAFAQGANGNPFSGTPFGTDGFTTAGM